MCVLPSRACLLLLVRTKRKPYTHTHSDYTLSQPPAGFVCRHLVHRPALRTQTPHLHTSPHSSLGSDDLRSQRWPTTTCFLAPARVTATPGMRHKFSLCPPCQKESSWKFTSVQTCWGLACGGVGGRTDLSTGRQYCANKRAGYLSSLLVLYGDQAEALGLSLEANMGTGQTSWALLLGLHSPDELI